jgi:putative redox protein
MSTSSNPHTIVVTHDGGTQFSARVRGHRVIVDQPVHGGGADAWPMPIELLGVSLGTCVALYVNQFLEARRLPHDGMRVEVEQVAARNPNRIGEFVVRVVLPESLPAAHAALLERVVRSCPAHNTLERAAHIRFEIEMPAPVAA